MNYLNTTIRIKPSDHVVILPQKVKRNNHVVILPQKVKRIVIYIS